MTQPLVFIDGDQGTTGLQIHERLQGRDDLRLLTLPAAERKDAARRRAINACDIAILCLPDEPARQAVASIRNPKVQVIDASSAHRTTEGWVYGFPEMTPGQDERIAGASRVSNPGCYPTGAIAAAPAGRGRPAAGRLSAGGAGGVGLFGRRPRQRGRLRRAGRGAAAVPGLRSGPGAQARRKSSAMRA